MLVPLDSSQLAEIVFPYAKELAGRLDLDLIFLHVCSPDESQSISTRRSYVERMVEIVRNQAQEVQERTSASPGSRAIETQSEVVTGHPGEEILKYADKNNIDIVLLATHGRSGIMRWAMGSVADKVLRVSKVPVWLVRAGIPDEIVYDKWPSRTILVPLDGSKLAESVLPHVEMLAKQRGAELVDVVLLRVCEAPLISADYPEASMPLSWDEHVKKVNDYYKHSSEQYLTEVEKQLKDAGLKVRSEVMEGKAADVIIEYVRKNPFNLVVIATHGHSGMRQWVYGSVADKILHTVSSPIFLVRPH